MRFHSSYFDLSISQVRGVNTSNIIPGISVWVEFQPRLTSKTCCFQHVDLFVSKRDDSAVDKLALIQFDEQIENDKQLDHKM